MAFEDSASVASMAMPCLKCILVSSLYQTAEVFPNVANVVVSTYKTTGPLVRSPVLHKRSNHFTYCRKFRHRMESVIREQDLQHCGVRQMADGRRPSGPDDY